MSEPRAWGWGSRNVALCAVGFNGVLSTSLGIVGVVANVFPTPEVYAVYSALANVATLAIIIGALGFLPWLRATFVRARQVASTVDLEVEWKLGPVVGFFIPFVNLVRPYRAVRALNEAVDPDRAPLPAPRLDESAANYRAQVPYAAPDLRRAPAAPVLAWWLVWMARPFVMIPLVVINANLIPIGNALNAFSAVLACLVVTRIDARLRESIRRRANADALPAGAG